MTANIGHNSVAGDQLKAIVERYERLSEEIDQLKSDQRDILAEAKGNGFDVPALREILKLRKQDADKRREREAIRDTYMHALGMIADLPLGAAAIERATS